MQTRYRYKPLQFFLLTYALTWIPWLIAAEFSYREQTIILSYIFFALGGLGPFASALILIQRSGSEALKKDFRIRLIDLRRINPPYLVVTILLMPCATFLAVWLSLYFGQSANQLRVVPNMASVLPLMIVAPTMEELGWRGYGMDSLLAEFDMLKATFLFGIAWAIWHVPLFFINHTYQHDLWLLSPVYVIDFFVSVIPTAVIANWLYYKHDRLIPTAILFHFMLDAVPESLNVGHFTKLIVTAIFLVIASMIAIIDRPAFSEGKRNFVESEPER